MKGCLGHAAVRWEFVMLERPQGQTLMSLSSL
jgi:hypothetical protein